MNGIPVVAPFSGGYSPENAVVILCIGNVVITPPLRAALDEQGYGYLMGDYVFMGTRCPFDRTRAVAPDFCIRSMACRYIYCPRLGSISKSRLCATKTIGHDPLFLNSITLVINSVCSLKCKYCTSYMTAYPAAMRRNVPLERILDDLDRVFAAVDGIGSVSIMGGEPFLHRDLAAIAVAVLAKENCTGLISIATSGIANIKEQQLRGLSDRRLNVSFGNYLGALDSRASRLWHDNVKLVQERGVPYTVGIDMPQWIVPSTLYDRELSVEVRAMKKSQCPSPPRMLHLKSGKIHPCDLANAVYSIGIADYPGDYVDVAHSPSPEALRERLREFMDAPYYHTCGHCACTGEVAGRGAEQGVLDFLTAPPRPGG
ncbi:MAG: radical SAM protein [Actinomycetes bacterium]